MMTNKNGFGQWLITVVPAFGRWAWLTLLGLFVACGGDQAPSEELGRRAEAIAGNNRILGFEGSFGGATGDWRSVSGAVSASATAFEGARALSVGNVWNPTVESAPLATLGPIASSATVHVRLPSTFHPQGAWHGQVALLFNSPTLGLNNAYAGPVPLGPPLGSFSQYTIPLPPDVVTQISTRSFEDLRVTVVVNAPSDLDAFVLDRLSFSDVAPPVGAGGAGGSTGAGGTSGGAGTPSTGGTSGSTNSSGGAGGSSGGSAGVAAGGSAGVSANAGAGAASGASGEGVEFFFQLPSGVSSGDVALGAYGGGALSVADNVEVKERSGAFASVSSVLGSAATDVGVTTEVQHLWSAADVHLRNGATVHGNLRTGGIVVPSDGSAVLGDTVEGANLAPERTVSWVVAIPGGESVSVAPNEVRAIPPGDYESIEMGASSHLSLAPGTYTVRGDLRLEPDSVIHVGNTVAPVHIYVRGGLILRGSIAKAADRPNVLIGVAGPAPVPVERPLDAILIASNAQVTLASLAAGHRGTVFARAISVGPNTTFTHDPITSDEICGGDAPCSELCPCGEGEPGCSTGLDCESGLSCVNDTCAPPECALNPRLYGCGYPGAPCGPCTQNPTCSSDADCPSGYVCPEGNGHRYGVEGSSVCEQPCCSTDPAACGGCGTLTSECGLCPTCSPSCGGKQCGDADLSDGCGARCNAVCDDGEEGCEVDSDCQPGSWCKQGTCRPLDPCAQPGLAPPLCGSAGAVCGACPPPSVPNGTCVDRACGADPIFPEVDCGTCPEGRTCSEGQCLSATDPPPIVVDGPDGTTRPVTPSPAPQASSIGAIPGQFSVSDRGSAMYVIPIEVPPGRAGIEPSVSLRYTSSTANGALGIGWSLDGFSSITRCGRSVAQDGYVEPTRSPVNDTSGVYDAAYCLDGQRLVRVADREYRTSIDTFSRIELKLGGDADIYSWVVRTKDGRILTYGGSPSTGLVRDGWGFIHTWALTRVEDRSGNYMSIAYQQVPSLEQQHVAAELLPSAITYTGHGATAGNRQVFFQYSSTRPDVLSGFRAGGLPMQRTRRLEKITTRVGLEDVKRYNLSYEVVDNTSRLTSVRECGGPADVECKQPTTFTYHEDPAEFEEPVTFSTPNKPGTGSALDVAPAGFVLPGAAGDYLSTVAVHSLFTPTQPIPEVFSFVAYTVPVAGPYISMAINLINIGTPSGQLYNTYVRYWFKPGDMEIPGTFACGGRDIPTGHVLSHPVGTTWSPELPVYLLTGVYDACPTTRLTGQVAPVGRGAVDQDVKYTRRTWLLDMDGDGVQDKLYCSLDEGALNYKFARAAQSAAPAIPVEADDGDRDGFTTPPLNDICRLDLSDCDRTVQLGTTEGRPVHCAAGSGFSISFDVDGDGAGNIVFYDRAGGWTALEYQGGEFRWRPDWFDGVSFDPNRYYVEAIDVNGDGLRDLLALPVADQPNIGSPLLAINTGDGFIERCIAAATPRDGVAPQLRGTPVDLDHDGIEELLEPAQEGAGPWRLRRIVAGTLTSELVPSLVAEAGLLGDFTGDGNLDVLTQGPPRTLSVHAGHGRNNHLLQRVTDGLGRTVDIEYEDENAEGRPVYEAHTPSELGSCRWPYRCPARVEQPLVSSHTESHYVSADRLGAAVDRIVSYSYAQPWVDTLGYGWLGFEQRRITMLDGAGDVVSSTKLTYEAPKPWDATTSTVPYVHVTAGLLKRSTEFTSAVSSSLIPHSPGKRTEILWTEKTSTAGRKFPFAELQITDVTNGPTPLHRRSEQRDVDGYGNVVSELIQDTDTSGFTIDDAIENIDGTLETIEITRNFTPTPEQESGWLIGLLKEETVSTAPRCPEGDAPEDCAARNRTRRSVFNYRPESGLLFFALREPGNSVLEQTTDVFHDEYGNPDWIQVRDRLGNARTQRITYDADGVFPLEVTRIGEGMEQPTAVRYDARFGTLIARADPNGIDETWTYDALGLLRHHRGPSGETTRDYGASDLVFVDGYGVFGNYKVTTRTGAAAAPGAPLTGGSEVEEHFNAFGQIVRRIGRGYNGAYVAEEFAYDFRNRLVAHQRPHIPFGPNLFSTTYEYDELDRVIAQHNPDGGDVEHEYTAIDGPDILADIPAEWELPDVRLIRRSTDPEGNATVELMNRDGAPVAVVDALGNFTRYQYGAFGTLRRITSPAGRDITFDHDAYGRTRTVNDPSRGLETTHFNGLDDVIRTTDALNRERELFYDDFGRLERIDDDDGSTHYAYDGDGPNEIGRLVEATSPTGHRTRYSYEPPTTTRNRGLLTGVTESAFPLGTDHPIERELTTRYHFDDAGRLSQVDYPKSESGGVSLRYHFDDYGHVVKVAGAQNPSNVFWELLEPEEGYRIGIERVGSAPCGSATGTTTTRAYKPGTDALSGITTTCGTATLQNLSYGYDEAGNLTSRNDAVANQNKAYRYDALNRLTHVNDIETYTYDPERGRLMSRAGAGSYSYRAEPTPASPRDWLESVGGPSGTTYDHDAVGNVKERSGAGVPGGRQAFTYTAFDLPKVIESGPAGSESSTRFAYSASGSRLAKQTEGPTPRVTFYAGDQYQRTEPTISATPHAAQHRSVIYAGGRAVAQLTSGENADGTLSAPAVRYLYDDVLGSVQTITDASGSPVGTRDYEAFGKHSGELSNDVMLGFTGHEEDTDLGLVNMKGRIYDPVAGQFLQTDPILAEPYSQGLNRYAYVNNSPLNFVDPTGLRADERDQLGIGVSAFGGGVIGGTACAAYCGSIGGWLGSGGAALTTAASAGLSAWNLMSPRVSHSGTSTAPQQSRSAPASGRGVPSRGRAAVSDVAPVREGGRSLLQLEPALEDKARRLEDALKNAPDERLACKGPLQRACTVIGQRVANTPAGRWLERQAAQLAPRVADLASRLGPRLKNLADRLLPTVRSQTEVLRDVFGRGRAGTPLARAQSVLQDIEAGNYKPPPGLTREHLEYYQRVARAAIEGPKGDPTGVQAVRLKITEHLLKVIK